MRALFIDDDSLNRTVMAAMLTVAGVDMDEAQGGAQGLSMIDVAEYDFILVDLRMPLMDGFEVVSQIRARGDSKAQVPLVVVTADISENLAERCLQVGADAMIPKPVVMDTLFETVGRILASRQLG